jgi:hypothetical protein
MHQIVMPQLLLVGMRKIIIHMRGLLFICFIFVFGSCSGEYFDHTRREFTPIISRDDTHEDTTTGTLYALPDKQVLDKMVSAIDSAKDRVWIEIYTWTEDSTLEALIKAKRR